MKPAELENLLTKLREEQEAILVKMKKEVDDKEIVKSCKKELTAISNFQIAVMKYKNTLETL
jgi:hypothetical protein